MKTSLRLFALLACLASFATAGPKPAAREETLFLFENRKLTIAVPDGFGYASNKDDRGVFQVKLGDPKNRVSLDVIFLPDPEERFKNARTRKELINEQFNDYVDSSSEKGMQFEELEPRTGVGTYCVFTDASLIGKANLPPGEYLHLTAGLKAWPGVVAIFRLFSNDTTSREYAAAMKMIRESVEERAVPLR